jgi:acetyl esterase/lipase
VVDLISYVAIGLSSDLGGYGPLLQIDPTRIAVAGTSAGGMCAYLAAVHAVPRPRALLSLYGMGGDWLVSQVTLGPMVPTDICCSQDSHMYSVKRKPFFMGYEILDPNIFSEFFYPASTSILPIAESPLQYHPPGSATPGYPSNPRMQLARVYIQEGVLMDYWTGMHDPSFSTCMRALLPENEAAPAQNASLKDARENMAAAIPESKRPLFPQLHISPAWPPSFFMHGECDSAVHADESRHLHSLLVDAGVRAELRIAEGAEHSFDYRPGADEKYGGEGGLYDQVAEFLRGELCS